MQSSFALLGLALLLLSPCTLANYRCYAFGDGVRLRENGSKYEATCADDSYDLFYKGTRVERNIAVCESNKALGWRTVAWPGESKYKEQVLTMDSETPAEFECRKAPTPCSFLPTEWLHFDEATKTLTCTNSDNTLRAIKHSYTIFTSLRCGRQGRSDVWKANAEYEWKETVGQYIAEASPTLNVTCAEYCKPTGDGLSIRRFGKLVEVTCADPNLDLSYEGHSRNKVRCSLEKGWTEGDKTITIYAKSQEKFNCAKACTLQPTSGIHFDSYSKTYSCSNDDSHFLNLITVRDGNPNIKTYDSIKCDSVNGWRTLGDETIPKSRPYDPLDAACVKYCSWSGNGTVVKRTSNELELSCAAPGFGLVLRFPSPRKSLKCNATSRWTEKIWGEERYIDHGMSSLELKCEKYHHSCDLASFEGFEYDKETKKLKCIGDAMHIIELNSRQYSFFLCDEAGGWAGQESNSHFTRSFNGPPLNGKCVEYCAVTGEGIKVERFHQEGYSPRTSVTCPDQGQLFYGDIHANGDKTVCLLSKGWHEMEGFMDLKKINLNHTSPVQFKCRPVPTTTAKPTTKRRVWRPTQTEAPLANAEAQTLIIICASIGVIVLILIVLIIVICVLKCQRRTDSGEIRTNNASERSEKRDRSYNDVARSARSER